jgi:ABC-type Na+ efflux pump permease subunit
MPCFTLGFLEQLIVWLIVVGAIVACIKLLVPWLSGIVNPIVGQIIMIILWAIVAIMVVYLIFGLLSCLVGSGPPFHPIR